MFVDHVSGNTMSPLLPLKNLRFAIVGQEAYGENASRGGFAATLPLSSRTDEAIPRGDAVAHEAAVPQAAVGHEPAAAAPRQ